MRDEGAVSPDFETRICRSVRSSVVRTGVADHEPMVVFLLLRRAASLQHVLMECTDARKDVISSSL